MFLFTVEPNQSSASAMRDHAAQKAEREERTILPHHPNMIGKAPIVVDEKLIALGIGDQIVAHLMRTIAKEMMTREAEMRWVAKLDAGS